MTTQEMDIRSKLGLGQKTKTKMMSAADAMDEAQEQTTQQTSEKQSRASPPEMDSQTLRAETQKQMEKFDKALENQQALEQWLRRVPDDPGGLLRRKFRYETMQRLRRGAKPDETIRW